MKKYLYLLVILSGATVLFQGFQCASLNLNTAKTAAAAKDYAKAHEYIDKELAVNPQSEEVWMLKADIYKNQRDILNLAKTLNEAEKVMESKQVVEKKLKDNMLILKYQLWIDCYKKGNDNFTNYDKTKAEYYLDSAIKFYNIAILVRPQMEDFHYNKALALLLKQDTSGALVEFNEFTRIVADGVDFALNKGLFLNQSRDEILRKLGKPAESTPLSSTNQQDSILTDRFVVEGKDIFIFLLGKKGEMLKLSGWRFNPSTEWLVYERANWTQFNIDAYNSLFQIYYKRKNYELAVKNLKLICQLEPTNIEANSYLVQVFQEQGKTNEALNYIKSLTIKSPDNKYYWAQYADIITNSGKFEEAIPIYEQALKIDSKFEAANRNIAFTYKNIAANIITKQREKQDSVKSYKGDPKEYKPYLIKAASYFEIYRTLSVKSNDDHNIIGELATIYLVLEEKSKLDKCVTDLETLGNKIDAAQKLDYYRIMCKLYGILQQKDKGADACKKLTELDK
ncbi:MAG: tetratricopeptide protein [Ignavibacteria bacterium]|nr:tetratricopeptide protein [Ignavibacteria bacterium]